MLPHSAHLCPRVRSHHLPLTTTVCGLGERGAGAPGRRPSPAAAAPTALPHTVGRGTRFSGGGMRAASPSRTQQTRRATFPHPTALVAQPPPPSISPPAISQRLEARLALWRPAQRRQRVADLQAPGAAEEGCQGLVDCGYRLSLLSPAPSPRSPTPPSPVPAAAPAAEAPKVLHAVAAHMYLLYVALWTAPSADQRRSPFQPTPTPTPHCNSVDGSFKPQNKLGAAVLGNHATRSVCGNRRASTLRPLYAKIPAHQSPPPA